MRKNSTNNNLLTKDYFDKKLDEKLKNFVTKDYLDKKLKNFVTHDYLDKRLNNLLSRLELRFQYFEEKFKKFDEIDSKLNKIMTTLDWLVGRYKKLDEENAVGFVQYKRVNEEIDNHEKRTIVLEKKATYKAS